MTEHPAGTYKFDPATKRIAVRTIFPEDGPFAAHAWCVASPDSAGGSFRSSAEVDGWTVIPTDVIDGLSAQEPANG